MQVNICREICQYNIKGCLFNNYFNWVPPTFGACIERVLVLFKCLSLNRTMLYGVYIYFIVKHVSNGSQTEKDLSLDPLTVYLTFSN